LLELVDGDDPFCAGRGGENIDFGFRRRSLAARATFSGIVTFIPSRSCTR
jgi:hypothetical protein